MIISAWKAFWRQFGFGRRTVQVGFVPGSDNWKDAEFFTIHRAKTERLASIARERGELKDARKKAVSQKKKVSDIDRALRALTNEEIKLELGR